MSRRTLAAAGLTLLLTLACADASATWRYRLTLRDKAGATLAPLSERAMARRAAQGIELDSLDLDLSPAYVDSLLAAGLTEVTRSRWMNTIVVQRPDGAAVADTVWARFGFIAERLTVSKTQSFAAGAPPAAGAAPPDATDGQRAHARKYGTTYDAATYGGGGGGGRLPLESFRSPVLELKGEALLTAGHRGAGKLIAVLDAGFRNVDKRDHLHRGVVGWRDMYRPAATDSTYIYGGVADSHGAECLSAMASDSARGVWGTAPDAQFYLVRTEYAPHETPLEEDMWIAGAELADSLGADLISSSLGYYEFDIAGTSYTQSQLATGQAYITRGAMAATARGILVVCAAGNEGYSSWGTIDFPSDAESVIAVGATTPQLDVASFSSPGFLAPWVKPDVVCRGQGAYVINTSTGNAMQGDGTSYATPLMCGLIASLWSAAPSLTAAQVRDIVRRSANHYDTPAASYGYGMPNFRTALAEALELEATMGLPPHPAIDDASPADAPLYDLTGRRCSAPLAPAGGYYIREGRLIMRAAGR